MHANKLELLLSKLLFALSPLLLCSPGLFLPSLLLTLLLFTDELLLDFHLSEPLLFKFVEV